MLHAKLGVDRCLVPRIQYIRDNSKLPPPVKQTVASLKQQSTKSNSLSFLKGRNNTSRSNNASARPTSSDSSLGAARNSSVQGNKALPTSAPDGVTDKARHIQAIRLPLMHLLALRPVSLNYLTKHINCSPDDAIQVLQKVGREWRLDSTKWDLNDRNFKELDVWNFDYKTQNERDEAITRSVSAFDRMRLSQEDPKWQMLYPPHERGKSKTLSKFHQFHKGPIQQSSTPRIHVQQPEDSQGEVKQRDSDENQNGYSTPRASDEMARSKPQGEMKKQQDKGEKDGQQKRLLSNGPKKAKSAPANKDPHPAVKKGSKKVVAPKSEEFVHDSDDEDGLEGAVVLEASSSPPKASNMVTPRDSTISPPTSSVKAKPKTTTASTKATATTKTNPKAQNRPEATKPSPSTSSGSSKTNANGVSKSTVKTAERKSSPNPETKTLPKKIPSSPAHTPGAKQRLSEAGHASTAMQKSLSRQRTLSSPLKPSPLGSSPPTNASEIENGTSQSSTTPPSSKKGETPNGILDHGRATPNSDASLKRKANDLDSGIHDHRSPLTNGYARSVKRHKPVSQSTPNDFDSSSTSSASPLSDREIVLQDAQRFKTLHVKYVRAYQEVARQQHPPPEKIQQVKKMHQRLEEMKRTITLQVLSV